jgi:hypothetical protein
VFTLDDLISSSFFLFRPFVYTSDRLNDSMLITISHSYSGKLNS